MSMTGFAPSGGPMLLAVHQPQRQRRLTVAVRLVLLVPHGLLLAVLWVGSVGVSIVGWFGALLTGSLPGFCRDYLVGVASWSARATAYAVLLTDRFPPIGFEAPGYPIEVLVPPPSPLNRLAVLVRAVLLVPAFVVWAAMAIGSVVASVVAWVVVLVSGRLPEPLHQAFGIVVRLQLRYAGYQSLVTSQYPWWGLFGDRDGLATAGGVPPPGAVAGQPGQWWPLVDPGFWPRGDLVPRGEAPAATGASLGMGAGTEPATGTEPDTGPEPATGAEPTPGAEPVRTAVPGTPAVPGQPSPEVFTYGGETYLWGYSADRQVCGIWWRQDPSWPGQIWPIGEQQAAWSRFREVEPMAVAFDQPVLAELEFGQAAPAVATERSVPAGGPPSQVQPEGSPGVPWPQAETGDVQPGDIAVPAGPESIADQSELPRGSGIEPGSDDPGETLAHLAAWTAAVGSPKASVPPNPGASQPGWVPPPWSGPAHGDRSQWTMVLSSTAYRLVLAMLLVGMVGLGAVSAAFGSTASTTVTKAHAEIELTAAYDALHNQFDRYEAETTSCETSTLPIQCVDTATELATSGFSTFEAMLGRLVVPAAAAGARGRLLDVSARIEQVYSQLQLSTTTEQYQAILTDSGLDGLLSGFDADYQQLQDDLAAG